MSCRRHTLDKGDKTRTRWKARDKRSGSSCCAAYVALIWWRSMVSIAEGFIHVHQASHRITSWSYLFQLLCALIKRCCTDANHRLVPESVWWMQIKSLRTPASKICVNKKSSNHPLDWMPFSWCCQTRRHVEIFCFVKTFKIILLDIAATGLPLRGYKCPWPAMPTVRETSPNPAIILFGVESRKSRH